MRARRYNKGKIRYELIPNFFKNELAKVFTMGAEKYTIRDENGNIIEDGSDNWRKGFLWKDALASVIRHLEKFDAGEDFDHDWPQEILDQYGPSLHLANAAWGISVLMESYSMHQELDNRTQWFKKPLKKVFCDLDGVLVDFEQHFLKYLNLDTTPPSDWDDARFRDNFEKISNDDNFWLTAPKLIEPIDITYPIEGYVTARPCDNEITQLWLDKNGFPKKKLVNVGMDGKKSDVLKGICDIFIDDSIKNFIDCQSNDIVCYLMTRPHNLKYDVGYFRVNDFKEFCNKIKSI